MMNHKTKIVMLQAALYIVAPYGGKTQPTTYIFSCFSTRIVYTVYYITGNTTNSQTLGSL